MKQHRAGCSSRWTGKQQQTGLGRPPAVPRSAQRRRPSSLLAHQGARAWCAHVFLRLSVCARRQERLRNLQVPLARRQVERRPCVLRGLREGPGGENHTQGSEGLPSRPAHSAAHHVSPPQGGGIRPCEQSRPIGSAHSVLRIGVRARRKKCPHHLQVPIACRKVERSPRGLVRRRPERGWRQREKRRRRQQRQAAQGTQRVCASISRLSPSSEQQPGRPGCPCHAHGCR